MTTIIMETNNTGTTIKISIVAADGAGLRPVVGDSNAGSRPDGKLQPGKD